MHLSMCIPSIPLPGCLRPGDLTSSSSNASIDLGAEFLIKSPYFRYSPVNITTDLWPSDHSQTCLEPIQVKGDHMSNAPPRGKGLSSIPVPLSKPLIGLGGGLWGIWLTSALITPTPWRGHAPRAHINLTWRPLPPFSQNCTMGVLCAYCNFFSWLLLICQSY